MTRTNIDLDDALVAQIMERFDLPTKKSAVDLALRRLVAADRGPDFVWSMRGTGWAGNLDEQRADPFPEVSAATESPQASAI